MTTSRNGSSWTEVPGCGTHENEVKPHNVEFELRHLDIGDLGEARACRCGPVDREGPNLQQVLGGETARAVDLGVAMAHKEAWRACRRRGRAVQIRRSERLEAKARQRRRCEALEGGRQAGQHASAVQGIGRWVAFVGGDVVGIWPDCILRIVREGGRGEVVEVVGASGVSARSTRRCTGGCRSWQTR